MKRMWRTHWNALELWPRVAPQRLLSPLSNCCAVGWSVLQDRVVKLHAGGCLTSTCGVPMLLPVPGVVLPPVTAAVCACKRTLVTPLGGETY